MSTYCKIWANISESQIPAYVKAALSVTSQVGDKNLSLLKAMEKWAAEHKFKLSDLYNEAGISSEQLRKLGTIEEGDSMYGGPDMEVPSALLVSAEGDVSDSDGTGRYGQRLGPVLDYLKRKGTYEGCSLNGIRISKILAVIPPSVAAQIFPNMKHEGTYFTIGIMEDTKHPLTKEQLPPGKYDPNKPVYPKTVTIACHNDHKRYSVFDAFKIFGKATKEIFRQTWKEEFIAMQNTAQSKKAAIKAFLINASQSAGSKINITSISDPTIQANSMASADCDFTVHLKFNCTFGIKDKFVSEFRSKVDEFRKSPQKANPVVPTTQQKAPTLAPKPKAPILAPKPLAPKPVVKKVEEETSTPIASPDVGPEVIRNY